ncbi:uncharacterized protein TrAtP1_011245 [Trichoderma atroviride]|uniref:uncharacterized protein n=1 Tax=Hypocrea atroviridis TaxID=63577 RepID=UPI0033242269|nr:hypothetical protein TrAtP1_011245 [Trichoderma atroviride]
MLRAALCSARSRRLSCLELCNPLIDPLASREREKPPGIVGFACTSAARSFYGALLVITFAGLLAFGTSRALVRWLLEVASPRPPSLETFITAPRPPLLTFLPPHLGSFFTPSRPKAQSSCAAI